MNRTKRLTGVCSECGGTIEFQAELVGTMTQCPCCGKQTELLLAAPPEEPMVPRKAIVWTVITIVILVVGVMVPVVGLKHYAKLAERQRDRTRAAASDPATAAAAQAGFEVSAISVEKGQGSSGSSAVGTVVNKSSLQRAGVALELDLLDEAGKTVGIARSYRPVLAPGAKWEFKVPMGDTQAVAAKLASIKEGK